MNRCGPFRSVARRTVLPAAFIGFVLVGVVDLWAESPHATAVAVSADYRRLYERDHLADWTTARAGAPGEAPTAFTRAGIVSHHLLAAQFIHDWFSQLAAVRGVDRFVIIGPRHFAQGAGEIVTSRRAWSDGENLLRTDGLMIERLVEAGVVEENDDSFYREHAIGTLVPFVIEYFPGAVVVPILIDPAMRWDERLSSLAAAIEREYAREEGTFLIVSADFSHHRGPVETARVDRINAAILADLSPSTARRAYSDNTRGLAVLAEIVERSNEREAGIAPHPRVTVRANSDSWLIWGRDAPDTTSYFFAYVE